MQRSLSPRLKRVLHMTLKAEDHAHWEQELPTHVDSVMAVSLIFPDGDTLAKAMDVPNEVAASVWQAADEEADAVEEARAKVRLVARRHAAPTPAETRLTSTSTRQRWSTIRTKRARAAARRADDAEQEADAKMEQALEEAFALADQAAEHSKRLQEMSAMQMNVDDKKGLLRNLFLHKVGVSATLETHLRNLARFRRWAAGKGVNPWNATALQLACFLRDESRSGPTVGAGLLQSLTWFDFALNLGWSLKDALVVSVAGKDRRQARAGREQARPFTQEVVQTLIDFHMKAEAADKLATGFALVQAMAVLRYSDLDRTKGMQLNADALYGRTWKSKSKHEGMPWAMPRHTWTGYDLGGEHMKIVDKLLGDNVERNWQWPAMIIIQGQLQLVQPPHHSSYGNCLMAVNLVLRKAGIEGDFTLHSPRFYLPGLAGQVGMTVEQRRTLGHWGPNSHMPVRYDQARCCTELKMKSELWQRLAGGWEPAKDFHIPTPAEVQAVSADMVAQRQLWHLHKANSTEKEADSLKVIINHRSMMLHRACADDPMVSACPHARSRREWMEATTEDKENLNLYTRCLAAACFGTPGAEPPTWKSPEGGDSASSSEAHASVVSSVDSSDTNSS